MPVATYMAEDWGLTLSALRERAAAAKDAAEVIAAVWQALCDFIAAHRAVFEDPAAAKVFCAVSPERHRQLIAQLAEIVLPHCRAAGYADFSFAALFLAENLLTFAVAGESFERLAPIFDRILK